MKKQYLIIGVVIVFVILGAIIFRPKRGPSSQGQTQPGGSIVSGNKRLTAKQAYDLALPEAKKYAADGFLVDMYSISSSYNKTYADGTSETWYFIFHSAAKPQYRVKVDGTKIDSATDISGTKTVEIPSGWLDSNEAVKIAADKCQGAPENSYFYNISTKTDNKSFVWGVACRINDKNQTTRLDAFSGKIEE